MRIAGAVTVVSLLMGVSPLQAQEPSPQPSASDAGGSKPTPMFAASAGLGTWDGSGLFGHLQASVEDGWSSIGLTLVAEAGLAIGGGGALTLTPGASLDLSSSPSPIYVRAGFSMFRTENLGFHVGTGIKTARSESGVRVEARIHVFPGGEETDYALEGMLTYQVPF